MNQFVNAVANQESRTANGMKARASTANACTDLFFMIGASRGKDIIPAFVSAYVEDRELALRIAAWVRDIRGGAGEREIFRSIVKYLNNVQPADALALIKKAPLLGRWDDLLVLANPSSENRAAVFDLIKEALENNNGLCAKWMPRKGPIAVALRGHLGWSPKFYRKRLVELTQVVETQMCAKDWDNINFSHVPSVAASRYRSAFYRNAPEAYKAYVESLVKGNDPKVKVNASAIFPHDVISDQVVNVARASAYSVQEISKTELDFITQQWEALPNYVGDGKILPMIDVSGSMYTQVGGTRTTALQVAVSLGLYLADKNTGPYKDSFLTFSRATELVTLRGNIIQKLSQMTSADWEMNTDLHAAFSKILQVAIDGNVTQEDMPEVLLILSDMQFDGCVFNDDSAIEMIRRKYEAAGYQIPKIVFWNLNAYSNVPVSFDEKGTALVSGFSPAILKAVLGANFDDFTPKAIMLKAIGEDKYKVI